MPIYTYAEKICDVRTFLQYAKCAAIAYSRKLAHLDDCNGYDPTHKAIHISRYLTCQSNSSEGVATDHRQK